jgi:hydrogenase nickel incorporation protein HypB
VTEGEDKPSKYPPMFQTADAVVITKMDLAPACGFNRRLAMEHVGKAAAKARIFETSSKTREGLDGWLEYLKEQQRGKCARHVGPS